MRLIAAEGESAGGAMQHNGPAEGAARLLAASGGRPPNVPNCAGAQPKANRLVSARGLDVLERKH